MKWNEKGSPIWKLHQDFTLIILQHMGWKSGNGTSIDLWMEPFSSYGPLGITIELHGIKHWILTIGKHTLYDSSHWTIKGDWVGWNLDYFRLARGTKIYPLGTSSWEHTSK